MFNLDIEAAKQAGQPSRIEESGIYTGTITRAEWSQSQSTKAAFLNIDFKADDGREANFMSICYQKGDGNKAFGHNLINAIMACCKLRSLSSAMVDNKQVAPELVNARISLALQAQSDWYKEKDGDKNWTGNYLPTINMQIMLPLNSETQQTAKELLDQNPAKTIQTLKVMDAKPRPMPNDGTQQAPQQQRPQQFGAEPSNDFDDDIPF